MSHKLSERDVERYVKGLITLFSVAGAKRPEKRKLASWVKKQYATFWAEGGDEKRKKELDVEFKAALPDLAKAEFNIRGRSSKWDIPESVLPVRNPVNPIRLQKQDGLSSYHEFVVM